MSSGEYRNEMRVEHMLRFANRITELTSGLSRDELETAGDRHDALLHNFIMLGEAANRITHDFAESHPGISWRQIAGLRHRLVHDYDEIDYDVLWEAMITDIPNLLPALTALVESLPPPSKPENIDDFA